MILETIGMSDVAAENFKALVPRHISDPEKIGPMLCSAGYEASPQRVPGALFNRNIGQLDVTLDAEGNDLDIRRRR